MIITWENNIASKLRVHQNWVIKLMRWGKVYWVNLVLHCSFFTFIVNSSLNYPILSCPFVNIFSVLASTDLLPIFRFTARKIMDGLFRAKLNTALLHASCTILPMNQRVFYFLTFKCTDSVHQNAVYTLIGVVFVDRHRGWMLPFLQDFYDQDRLLAQWLITLLLFSDIRDHFTRIYGMHDYLLVITTQLCMYCYWWWYCHNEKLCAK